MNRVKLANFLIELRKEKELLQNDIAELFMVSPQAVSKWERGESIPDIEILEKIAKYYNVSIEEILNGERKKEDIKQESKTTENNKSKVFNIVFSSIFLAIFWLLSISPFFEFNIGTTSFVNSLVRLMFNATPQFANLLMLFAFLCFNSATIIDIVASSLRKIDNTLLIIRNFCALISLGVFTGLFVLYFSHPSITHDIGSILITILNIAYSICLFCLKNYRIEYQNKGQRNKNISSYFKLSFIFAMMICVNFASYDDNTIMFVLTLLPFLSYIGVSIAMYFAKEKKTLYIWSVVLNCIIIAFAVIGFFLCHSYHIGYSCLGIFSFVNLILLTSIKLFKYKYQ